MRSRWRLWVALIAIVSAVAAANIPLTTLQGVNHVVSAHTIPAYVKAIDFIDRDLQYRRLAPVVTSGAATDEAKAKAVFSWTRANIRDTPEGFPVIDDHIWHIIVRGYGQSDQKADVFTTLLTYAGVPSYFIFIGRKPELVLSLAKVDGAWRVADVANGVIFRSRNGEWATAEELAADPLWMSTQGPETVHDLPYARFFDDFNPPAAPALTRADMQAPGARTWFAIKKVFGRAGGREWEMRPASRRKSGSAS